MRICNVWVGECFTCSSSRPFSWDTPQSSHTRELPVLQETAAVLQHTTRELPMLQHDAPVPHTNTRALPMLQHNAPELQQEAREQDHSKDELLAGTFQHMCALFCCVLIFPFCLWGLIDIWFLFFWVCCSSSFLFVRSHWHLIFTRLVVNLDDVRCHLLTSLFCCVSSISSCLQAFVRVHVCIVVCVCSIHPRVHTNTHSSAHAHAHLMCVCVCACMCIYMCVCLCVWACVWERETKRKRESVCACENDYIHHQIQVWAHD